MVRACDVVADIDRERSCVVRSRRKPAGRGRVREESEERREEGVGPEAVGELRSAYRDEEGECASSGGMVELRAVSNCSG